VGSLRASVGPCGRLLRLWRLHPRFCRHFYSSTCPSWWPGLSGDVLSVLCTTAARPVHATGIGQLSSPDGLSSQTKSSSSFWYSSSSSRSPCSSCSSSSAGSSSSWTNTALATANCSSSLLGGFAGFFRASRCFRAGRLVSLPGQPAGGYPPCPEAAPLQHCILHSPVLHWEQFVVVVPYEEVNSSAGSQ
jgi:hypothetical protein